MLGDCFHWESRYFCFLHVFDVLSNNLILKGQKFQGCVIRARTHSDVEMMIINTKSRLRFRSAVSLMVTTIQQDGILPGQNIQGLCSENLNSTNSVDLVSPTSCMPLSLDQSKKAMKIREQRP